MRRFSIGSRAEADFRSALRDAGFVSVVTKPFEPRERVETIARIQPAISYRPDRVADSTFARTARRSVPLVTVRPTVTTGQDYPEGTSPGAAGAAPGSARAQNFSLAPTMKRRGFTGDSG
jgi:hypothetical protein